MPVHKIQGGYQYGQTGKRYYGKDAKEKAEKQALAIRLSGYKEADPSKSVAPKVETPPLNADLVKIGRSYVSRLF